MRILFFLIVGFSNCHVRSETITITDEHLSTQFVAEAVSDLLVHRLIEKGQEQKGVIPEKDVRYPILPPTITIPFLDYRFVLTDNLLVEGFYEHFDSALELAIQDDLSVEGNETSITLEYTSNVDEIALRGNYSMALALNFTYLAETIPDFPIEVPDDGLIVPIEGTGGYEVAMKDFAFQLTIEIDIAAGKIETVKTSIGSFSFGGLRIYFDNLLLNGYELDDGLQEFVGELLKSAIDTVLELIHPTLEELLEVILTQLFEGCEVSEIIDGDFSCVGFPPPSTRGPTTEAVVTEREPTSVTQPDPDVSTTPGNDASQPLIQFATILVASFLIMLH